MHHDLIIPKEIDSFDVKKRYAVLADISRTPEAEAQADKKLFNRAPGAVNHAYSLVNMHIHSFYSFNSQGYSPAHIALACRQNGLYAAALCDFDVLDGLEEFIAAGQMLGLRTAVHLETRAFLREYALVEINSPGEPGVTYILGAGFFSLPEQNSAAMKSLGEFRQQANLRNRALVGRINERLPEISINYDTDVIPLSPGGCPTERHIVQAYRLKAQRVFPSREELTAFWAKLLRKTGEEVERFLNDLPVFDEKVRALLAKSGGIGYVRPDEKTFPPVDDFIACVLQCEAIPMASWLDGTSKGENNMLEMLECLKAKGAAALNIILDRVHNLKNTDERRIKLKNLNEVISAARKLAFPINIGTEMNKSGQPFVDDLECEALAPYKNDFMRGANIMIGQTILARYAGFSYCGKSALGEYGGDTERKNNFFEAVGKLPPLSVQEACRLADMGREIAFQFIRDSVLKMQWKF